MNVPLKAPNVGLLISCWKNAIKGFRLIADQSVATLCIFGTHHDIAVTELKTAELCHCGFIAPTFGDGSNNRSDHSMCCISTCTS
jgi:hypothetical protein